MWRCLSDILQHDDRIKQCKSWTDWECCLVYDASETFKMVVLSRMDKERVTTSG